MKVTIKICVIEDHIDTLDAIAIFLETEGDYQVSKARSISEAIVVLQTGSFHIYLIDRKFPDGDGLDLCRRIREFAKTPIVIISAAAYPKDISDGLAAGATRYITKPFDLDHLRAEIDSLTSVTTFSSKSAMAAC